MELNAKLFSLLIFSALIINVVGQEYGNRRRPRPGRRGCRWGSVGVCGGFANADCPPNSRCRFVWSTSTAGQCCRNRPEPKNICGNKPSGGSCGGFVGTQCRTGYTCRYRHGSTRGTCCHTENLPNLPVCKQPKKVGRCRAAMPRWFYNSKTSACEHFIYGGCGGNDNNFERQEECEGRCGTVTPPQLHVCKQPKVVGPCRGSIPRWFYNSKTKDCQQFIYGGCQGNDNNFERRVDCVRRCDKAIVPNLPVCKQPKKVGLCRAAMPRWFYNSKTSACEHFIYGGCGGNDNNFERQEECEGRCGTVTPPQLHVCKQPKVVGPCRGSIPRWFYNSKTKACEQFIYGGCQGNDNNFERRVDCVRRCDEVIEPVCGNQPSGGTCGGFVGTQCRPGYTCTHRNGSSLGTCCKNEHGKCPSSSGNPGICVFDPNVNCLSDKSCRNGKICCPEGCGRVCKNPVYEPNPNTHIIL